MTRLVSPPNMKAGLTDDDMEIWYDRACPGRPEGLELLRDMSCKSDTRDGDLMLEAQLIAQFGPVALQLYGMHFRGWDAGWIMMPGVRKS